MSLFGGSVSATEGSFPKPQATTAADGAATSSIRSTHQSPLDPNKLTTRTDDRHPTSGTTRIDDHIDDHLHHTTNHTHRPFDGDRSNATGLGAPHYQHPHAKTGETNISWESTLHTDYHTHTQGSGTGSSASISSSSDVQRVQSILPIHHRLPPARMAAADEGNYFGLHTPLDAAIGGGGGRWRRVAW